MKLSETFKDRNKLYMILFITVISIIAIIARFDLYPISCGDQTIFLIPWFDKIKENGGFAALSGYIGDYTPPYYYIMAILTYLPFEAVSSIKTVSCIFDFILAIYVFKIVYHFTANGKRAAFAYGTALLIPTIILNSAAWGQCDAIYITFVIMSVYYILANKEEKAIAFFSIALCFKLQAIFAAPFLLVVLLKKRVSYKKLWIFPVVCIAAAIPAIIAGDSLLRILGIYVSQTGTWTHSIAFSIANIYGLIGGANYPELASAGVMLAGAAAITIIYYSISNNCRLTDNMIITGITLCAVIVPFLLPYMHERYYYMAVVFLLIMAFIDLKNFWLLIAMEIVSVVGMSDYLLENDVDNWFILSLVVLAIIFKLFVIYKKLIDDGNFNK